MAGDYSAADQTDQQKGCYLWTPDITTEPVERPAKRRRVTSSLRHPIETKRIRTVPLLLGKELEENVRLRAVVFDEFWHSQEQIIHELVENTVSNTVDQVCDFVRELDHIGSEASIPSALISVGTSNSTFTNLVHAVKTRLQAEQTLPVINLIPSQTTNLKSALKLINSHASGAAANAEEDGVLKHEQPSRQLNYDLQKLYDHVQTNSTKQIILAFHDSETFDEALLNDIVELLSAWHDRIPFLCLFGIKTSIELFQEKLRRKTIQQLYGMQFEVAQINIDSIFKAVSSRDHVQTFWLGPGITSTVLQAQQTSIQGVASFTRALQYAYMAHIFANPLSILAGSSVPSKALEGELYECVRSLSTFRQYVEDLLDQKDFKKVRRLLEDDKFLHEQVVEGIQKCRKALEGLVAAIELLVSIQKTLNLKTAGSWSSLYIQAMAGELRDSAVVKDTQLAVKKLSSEVMTILLEDIADSPIPNILTFIKDLRRLVSGNDSNNPLRSEHDTHHASLRATVVSHKVGLSKHSASLSKHDMAYSRLVSQVDSALEDYFQHALVNPQELFLHEVLVYDLKSPHREVFAPKPRYAVERALRSPRDYLGCSCCKGAQHGLSSTHPATSLLYQLYLESGAIINISDLWSAFYTIIGREKADDEDAEQERALTLFFRALGELKYMGMIKNSRKKADHLARLLWNGL